MSAGRPARIVNGAGMKQAFIGVDVGTSSARAGVFDEQGMLLATARHPITIWHEAGHVVEQSSSDIWAACVASVRAAMAEAALPASAVKGIGFDATCSLVVLDGAFHLHGDVQVEFSRARTALERQLFRARRSGRSRLGWPRENRKRYRCT